MRVMKKTVSLLLLALLVWMPAASAASYNAELEPEFSRMHKLQRGFLNVALSPLEIVHGLSEGRKKEDVVPGWAQGLVLGGAATFGRAVTGIYEMATFFIPVPSGYVPMIQPEFAYQYFEDKSASV